MHNIFKSLICFICTRQIHKQLSKTETWPYPLVVSSFERMFDRFVFTCLRYQLMTECWKEDPCSRPSFFRMIEKLEAIMERGAPYLDLNKHKEAHTYNNVPPGVSPNEETSAVATVSQ